MSIAVIRGAVCRMSDGSSNGAVAGNGFSKRQEARGKRQERRPALQANAEPRTMPARRPPGMQHASKLLASQQAQNQGRKQAQQQWHWAPPAGCQALGSTAPPP
jgi:hypothetical protein